MYQLTVFAMHSLAQLAPLKPPTQKHVQVPTSSTPPFWHVRMQAVNERREQIGNMQVIFLAWSTDRMSTCACFYSFTNCNYSGIVTLSKNWHFCWTQGVPQFENLGNFLSIAAQRYLPQSSPSVKAGPDRMINMQTQLHSHLILDISCTCLIVSVNPFTNSLSQLSPLWLSAQTQVQVPSSRVPPFWHDRLQAENEWKGKLEITQVSGHILQSTNHTPSPLNKVTAWRS